MINNSLGVSAPFLLIVLSRSDVTSIPGFLFTILFHFVPPYFPELMIIF
jgi:hypothetical protein